PPVAIQPGLNDASDYAVGSPGTARAPATGPLGMGLGLRAADPLRSTLTAPSRDVGTSGQCKRS
ncbi:MAG TPA: hypothetical protein VIK18_23790, partial [Pirellulales bacterium]